MSSVAVVVLVVRARVGVVGQHGTALERDVLGIDAGVEDVGVRPGAGGGVVDVLLVAWRAVGDAAEAPGGILLGDGLVELPDLDGLDGEDLGVL
jgi:hypothetical protein